MKEITSKSLPIQDDFPFAFIGEHKAQQKAIESER